MFLWTIYDHYVYRESPIYILDMFFVRPSRYGVYDITLWGLYDITLWYLVQLKLSLCSLQLAWYYLA
jgi:hypothetical protein